MSGFVAGVSDAMKPFSFASPSAKAEFGTKRSNRLLRGDSGDRGVRGGSVLARDGRGV